MREADPEAVRRLVRHHRLPEVVARLLVCRGHRPGGEVETHLGARLNDLHAPAALPGMGAACERIARAVRGGERILVHGDYDVDGVAGTALLMRAFERLGADAVWHIPNRLTDGYSFGPHSVARARAVGARVVVSVDNGTSAGATIEELARAGIDTVVTDHHEPPNGPLPPAAALVNPKLPGSTYPFRELCGSGVAFKLAWGVCLEISESMRVRPELRSFLLEAMAYVAMATVCDVVPLVGENRILARHGLVALERAASPGLAALLDVARLRGRPLVAEDVAFKLGPRLNAAGRLGSAATAVELLLAREPDGARRLACDLDRLNDERRRIETELVEAALGAAREFEDGERWPVLVVAGQGWHQGVVGIVASRLVDRFARPALVIGLAGETGRGSARSVPGVDVLEALHAGAEHMLRYGGHAQAAGCEVRADAVDALREAVCERARERLAGNESAARADGRRELWIDDRVPLPQVTPELMRHLDRLEPFGEANEKPVLLSDDVRLAEPPRAVGADGSHLMLRVRHGDCVLKAMAFGMGDRSAELAMGRALHVVHTPRWNVFRGEARLELVLHDFRVGEPPSLGAPLSASESARRACGAG